jgi:hypothetical protein
MGIKFLAAFFLFGSLMSGLAGATLFNPGTFLDRVWIINPQGHASMLEARLLAALGMTTVSAIMAVTAFGLFGRRVWAWWAALAVLSANTIGDLAAAIIRRSPDTLVGLPIAGGIIWWLTRARPRFK